MKSRPDSAPKVAEFLLQIKAVQLNVLNPYTWASGWKSPIYCDNRKTLSYPSIRTYIRQQFAEAVMEAYGKPDVIAGVATGGIAHGVLVAQELGVPFVYVRSAAKGHGLQNLIEGVIEGGESVVVIEDLVSTGKSSLAAVDALRAQKCEIKGMCAIFSYGFEIARKAFEDKGCPLVTLTDYNTLLDEALRQGYISENQLVSLRKWRESPQNWGLEPKAK